MKQWKLDQCVIKRLGYKCICIKHEVGESKMIFIVCPAYKKSGGPELLHQLCAELRLLGHEAVMKYVEIDSTSAQPLQNEAYNIYNVPWADGIVDSEENIVIIPEVYIWIVASLKMCKCMFWWMSVDNAYISYSVNQKRNLDKLSEYEILIKAAETYGCLHNPNVIHLAQSYYAIDHCHKIGIADNNIKYLADYIRDDYIENSDLSKQMPKENIVLYNPAKGAMFTQKLMNAAPDIKWIPLIGFSVEEMMAIMMTAKVYIDFGEHPGMDRIPREAAICGCCVITGRRGSAAFHEDVPIPEEYKFDDREDNINNIIGKIKDVFDSYTEHNKLFREYRLFIKGQKQKFHDDVIKIFGDMRKS